MIRNWFRRRQEVSLEPIHERLNALEQTMRQMFDEGFKNQIHIDTLNVHNPVLEKLEFRLDQLDIDEVSGALNLGNNFGVRVNSRHPLMQKKFGKDREEDSSIDESTQNHPSDRTGATTSMRKTSDGFTFRFSSK